MYALHQGVDEECLHSDKNALAWKLVLLILDLLADLLPQAEVFVYCGNWSMSRMECSLVSG